jgi:predicted glycosyltransferase
MKRLLMYSQDGMGLGHLRRSSNIAQEVRARNPGCDVLIVADSPATSLFSYQEGIDCLKLPTVVKTGPTSWESASLTTPVTRLIKLRARAIAQAFDDFEPDTVLIDHMPVGALGELKPMLDRATNRPRPPRLFLGLRDVLDDPAVIRPVWSDLGAYGYLPSYESVLVYGSDRVYDASAEYRLLQGARSVVYCGYVSPRTSSNGSERRPDTPFLLMMGGGGSDAFPLAEAFVEAFPRLLRDLGMPGVLVTGPSMSRSDRQALQARADRRLLIESGLGHAAGWVKHAAAVVTMGGYNSLCEVLKWRKKALVVPRKGPSAEQRIRARIFAERSLVRVLPPGPTSPNDLVRALTRLIAENGVPDPENIPPLNGAERVAELLLDRQPIAAVARDGQVGSARVVRRTRRSRDPVPIRASSNGRKAPTVDLPLLEAALDPGEMRRHLGELLAPGARNGSTPRLASVDLIAYRQGRRALIAYEVELPSKDRRVAVLGKHFRDTAQARRVWETSLALHRTPIGRGFAVPQPLDWIPELSLVLYQPAKGRSFAEARRVREAGRFLRHAAESLAELHASGLSLDRRFALRNELNNLASWAELVGATHPDQESAALEVLDRLQALGPEIGFSRDVPIHKDLHYEHLVLGSRLAVLDIDEMRFGDPTFDLSHFCTYLHLLAIRCHSPALADAFEQAFLEEYARHTGWTRDERFTYFYVYTCLKIAKQLCLIEGVAPRPRGPEQQRQVRKVLKRARSLLVALA